MYKCFAYQESNLDSIIEFLQKHIEQLGTNFIEDKQLKEDPCASTKKLLDFKDDMNNLVQQAFNNNMKFERGRDIAFQNFMN